jgi:2-C-methyl-D-erythritol 4-phosphate cytidylyltransferase
MLVGGFPLLIHTLRVFERAKGIQEIILVIPKEEEGQTRALLRDYGLKKISKVVFGGKTRQESVYAGLLATAPDVDLVAVHDGARPLVTEEIIDRTIARARELGGAIAAVPVSDTLKESSLDGCIKRTWDRHGFWLAQTPQTFRRKVLLSAYEQATAHNRIGTDEASLVEPLGYPVGLVEGSRENIKVTTPIDLEMANYLLSIREAE